LDTDEVAKAFVLIFSKELRSQLAIPELQQMPENQACRQ